MPAALCGCTGFIASLTRIHPQGPHLSATIGQTGTFTTCTRDAALIYALIADQGVAPLRLPALGAVERGGAVQGLRVGVFQPWFDDCDGSVRRCCESAVAALQSAGALYNLLYHRLPGS